MKNIFPHYFSFIAVTASLFEKITCFFLESLCDAFLFFLEEIRFQIEKKYPGEAHKGGMSTLWFIFYGSLDGFLQAMEDSSHSYFQMTQHEVKAIGSLFRLDFAGAMAHLIEFFIYGLDGLLICFRFLSGGYFNGGLKRYYEREELKKFVEDLLSQKYSSSQLEKIEKKLKLDGPDWGFPMKGKPVVFYLDSGRTPLWKWHKERILDLYTLAGYFSFQEFSLYPRPQVVVKKINEHGHESIFHPSRKEIQRYIESEGKEGRFRIYATSFSALGDKLRVARKKARQLGVRLAWEKGDYLSSWQDYTCQLIDTKEEFHFVLYGKKKNELESYLLSKGLRTGLREENKILLSLSAFRFAPLQGREFFGMVAGRKIIHNPPSPNPQGRSDHCVSTLAPNIPSGIIHRDVWPSYGTRYVLAHEMGHYLGLCHVGHHGIHQIMFTPNPGSGLRWINLGLLHFYFEREPGFSLEDGKNTWRFLLDQMDWAL